ncbi:MAG: hypothetical protein R2705_17305 [Ilumatobacteraceae bacterium]
MTGHGDHRRRRVPQAPDRPARRQLGPPVPAAVGLADAAAIPEVFSAWDALVLKAGSRAGGGR